MTTTYLNCPRCGLSVENKAGEVPEVSCPRCRGQAHLIVPMYETDRPRPPVHAPEPMPNAA
jgi:uncharacterized Zn finger protein (UPF0148 family)